MRLVNYWVTMCPGQQKMYVLHSNADSESSYMIKKAIAITAPQYDLKNMWFINNRRHLKRPKKTNTLFDKGIVLTVEMMFNIFS